MPSNIPTSRYYTSGSVAWDPALNRRQSGWVLSSLAVLYLAIDGTAKLLLHPVALDPLSQLGHSAAASQILGAFTLAAALLLAFPRTALAGAALFVPYLATALATRASLGDPLFPIIFGALAWTGLFLRQNRLSILAPIRG